MLSPATPSFVDKNIVISSLNNITALLPGDIAKKVALCIITLRNRHHFLHGLINELMIISLGIYDLPAEQQQRGTWAALKAGIDSCSQVTPAILIEAW